MFNIALVHSYNFSLKALNVTFSFKIASPNKQDVDQFFYAFMPVFPGVMDYEKKSIHCFTSNSAELRTNLRNFVSLYQDKMPALNGIEAFIRKLDENESFYVIPALLPDQAQYIRLFKYLHADKNGINFEDLNDEVKTVFGDFMKSYEIAVYGDTRRCIGERSKKIKFAASAEKNTRKSLLIKRHMPFRKPLATKPLF